MVRKRLITALVLIVPLFIFQETYPTTPPVWFSESEDAKITNALGTLSETSGLDNHLLYQVSTERGPVKHC